MQADRRGIRNVEAADRSIRGDAYQAIAALTCQLAQALAFSAQHECHALGQRLVLDEVFGCAIEPENGSCVLLQFSDGA